MMLRKLQMSWKPPTNQVSTRNWKISRAGDGLCAAPFVMEGEAVLPSPSVSESLTLLNCPRAGVHQHVCLYALICLCAHNRRYY